MALTREQFQELRNKGLSVDQIVKFESGEKPTQTTQPAQPSEDIALGLLIGAAKGAGSTLESGLRSIGQIAGGIGGAISVPIQERQQADLVTQYKQALQDKNPALAKQIYNQINQAGAMSRQAQ
jgi:hypothetical protein